MDKEELFVKRIRELANLAYQRDITTFTDFLNLNERNILNSQNFHKLGVTAEGAGLEIRSCLAGALAAAVFADDLATGALTVSSSGSSSRKSSSSSFFFLDHIM